MSTIAEITQQDIDKSYDEIMYKYNIPPYSYIEGKWFVGPYEVFKGINTKK